MPRIARGLEGKKINLSSPLLVLAEGKKINLAVGAQWHSKKKEKKGRFGVGAGLRGQTLDRPPILRGSVGPD